MLIRQMGEPTRTSDNRSDRGAQLDWELDPELQLLAVEKPPGKLTLRALELSAYLFRSLQSLLILRSSL